MHTRANNPILQIAELFTWFFFLLFFIIISIWVYAEWALITRTNFIVDTLRQMQSKNGFIKIIFIMH